MGSPEAQRRWTEAIEGASERLAHELETVLRKRKPSTLEDRDRDYMLAAFKALTRIPDAAASVANIATARNLERGA